jgi:hypothetical protein
MDRRPCEPSPREKRQREVNKANDVPRARRHRMDRNTATPQHCYTAGTIARELPA